jgi:DNA-directed RNA polymerase subunit RPC12/RpoP
VIAHVYPFSCAHCDALLAVPTGPWACQTCTLQNAEEAASCTRCSQKKTDQKAICGVCGQSTKIPSSNFGDQLSHNMRSVSKTSKRLLYDVSGTPYVTCPRCSAHIKVAVRKPASATEMKEGVVPPGEARVPAEEAAGKGSAPAAEGAASPAASAAAASPAAGAQDINDEIICEKCKHRFSANE